MDLPKRSGPVDISDLIQQMVFITEPDEDRLRKVIQDGRLHLLKDAAGKCNVDMAVAYELATKWAENGVVQYGWVKWTGKRMRAIKWVG